MNRKPINQKEHAVPFSTIIGETRVVQDYPKEYKLENNRRRTEDKSFLNAKSDGFVYGIRLYNDKKTPSGALVNWTRIIMVKPSKPLMELWNSTALEGYSIEAITFEKHGANEHELIVKATYMNSVGSIVLGYVSKQELDAIEKNAWNVELEQPAL